jgi:hypothetical protein
MSTINATTRHRCPFDPVKSIATGTYEPPNCSGGDSNNSNIGCEITSMKEHLIRHLVALLRERDIITLSGLRLDDPLPIIIRSLARSLDILDDDSQSCSSRLTQAMALFDESIYRYASDCQIV